jgi:LuxR family maltose regulon positive regulatory protein
MERASRARREAEKEGQYGLCVCADLVIARAAISLGNANDYASAARRVEDMGSHGAGRGLQRMSELALTVLSLLMNDSRAMPAWVDDAAMTRRMFFAPAIPYAMLARSGFLLRSGRYGELAGVSGPLERMAEEKRATLPRVYQILFRAAARELAGEHEQALGDLRLALELALPDGAIAPFASFGELFVAPLSSVEGSFPPMKREQISDAVALCQRQARGAEEVKRVLAADAPRKLSRREDEIARLASRRMRVTEIASQLVIAPNTVKSTLKHIYIKLGVHSRDDLMAVMAESE